MPPLLPAKTEGGIEQALHIEVDHRTDEVQVLERDIEQQIPVRLGIIPSGKTGHPGADVEDTEDQKETEPFISSRFIDQAFPEQEDRIDQPVNKEDQQDGTEGIKTE